MNRLGRIAVGLAGGLALNVGLCAPNSPGPRHLPLPRHAPLDNPSPANPSPVNSLAGNPFAVIAERNVFGLVPPTAKTTPKENPEKSLPKITPEGISGVFGNWQVLFKVAPAKAGPKEKEKYYILSKGEMQDDIEVVKIDDANSMVTFDNHGTTQELPLAEAKASGGAASSFGGGANYPGAPGARGGPGRRGPGGIIHFGAGRGPRNGVSMNGPGGGNGGPGPAGMNFGDSTQGHTTYQPPAPDMTPEQTAVIIEAQRAALTTEAHPAYSPSLLPPTPLTKYNTPDNNQPPAP